MNHHCIRTAPEAFASILDGSKRYLITYEEIGIEVGDELTLMETDPATGKTLRSAEATVSHKTPGGGESGLAAGVCVLGLKSAPAELSCNCPGGLKPPRLHAPNCPARTTTTGEV